MRAGELSQENLSQAILFIYSAAAAGIAIAGAAFAAGIATTWAS
jgi:hypothetical protein